MKGILSLVPAPGATIRDPRTGRMVSGPVNVPDNTFWRRRVRDKSMLPQVAAPPPIPVVPVEPAPEPVRHYRGKSRPAPAPEPEPEFLAEVTPETSPEA